VRDSFIILGVVASLTGSFLLWRKHFVEVPEPTAISKNFKPVIKPIKGDKTHERTNTRSSSKKRDLNPSKRTARKASESPELSDFSQAEEFVEEDFDVLLSSEQDKSSPVVVGVPIAAWVKARMNRFKDLPSPQEGSQNLRLFVGCMELKKGPQKTERHDCEKILAARESKLAGERERY